MNLGDFGAGVFRTSVSLQIHGKWFQMVESLQVKDADSTPTAAVLVITA